MSDEKEVLMVTLPDGTEREMAGAAFRTRYSVKIVNPDGTEVDLGRAYRILLTYQQWADEEIDRLNTALADWKSHQVHCPLAQEELAEDGE